MSARMILAVYLAMSRPVAKRFWITITGGVLGVDRGPARAARGNHFGACG